MSWMLTRREMLAATAVTAAYAAAGRLFEGMPVTADGRRIALALVDEDSAAGLAFAREARAAGIRTVSVAEEDARFWSSARRGFDLAPDEAAIGFTRWSDWISLRPAFAEHRRHPRVELRVDGAREAVVGDLLAMWNGDGMRRAALSGPRGGGTRFAWLVA